jgi:hypothetical protein
MDISERNGIPMARGWVVPAVVQEVLTLCGEQLTPWPRVRM